MIEFNQINELIKQSKQIQLTGNEYVDNRVKWAYDQANQGQEMWWGGDKPQPYYIFLYLLTKTFPGLYLEIGTHKGIALACAAGGINDSTNPKLRYAIGVDVSNHSEANEVEKIFNRTLFINGSSLDRTTFQRVKNVCQIENLKIKIMFIDAVHKMSYVNSELFTYKELYDEQVIWVFDDIIKKANNTHLPLMFERLPGQKLLVENLHTDNAIGVALVNKFEYGNFNPGEYSPDEMERGFKYSEAKGPDHHERW